MKASWQPVHVLYGGAHLFRATTAARAGQIALQALDTHGYFDPLPAALEEKVRQKLQHEPVEDFRIDFEDGYGARTADEEDVHARAAAEVVAAGSGLPRRVGIRIRALAGNTEARARRTLSIFLDVLAGRAPTDFVVTLPKVESRREIGCLVGMLDSLPNVRIELMIETPAALRFLPDLFAACEQRCAGLHFGAYDYMAACGIGFPGQTLLHPVCDFARSQIQMHVADLGIPVVDGVTNLIPAGDTPSVHDAWKQHAEAVRHALRSGIYQGWDIHPAQLVSRYVEVFSFFTRHAEEAARRLCNFLNQRMQAVRTGAQFDDAATVAGLVNFFERGLSCGAMDEAEVRQLTGLNRADFSRLQR